MRYDALVIGSDPVGIAAANEAAARGLRVAIVDDGHLDPTRGTCRSSIVAEQLRGALEAVTHQQLIEGRAEPPEALRGAKLLERLARRRRTIVGPYLRELRRRLAARGIHVRKGPARFVSARRVQAPEGSLEARLVVICASSRPRRPPELPFDDRIVCDSDSLGEGPWPRSVLVLGAEGQGCELACLYSLLGSQVTLIDRRTRMLRYFDHEIVAVLHERMQRMGIQTVLGEWPAKLVVHHGSPDSYCIVQLESGRSESWERVIVALGRVGCGADLDLGRAGVETDPLGFVVADEGCRTSAQGVYAAGDAISAVVPSAAGALAGRAVMREALGLEVEPMREQPIVIGSIPELATVGLSAAMCRQLDVPHVVGTARYDQLLSRRMAGEGDGLVKLVVGVTDRRVLGVQLAGAGARELAQLGAVLVFREPVDRLASHDAATSRASLLGLAAMECIEQLPRPESDPKGP